MDELTLSNPALDAAYAEVAGPAKLLTDVQDDCPGFLLALHGRQEAPSGAIVPSGETECAPCEEIDAGGFFRPYRVP